jgi:hypothetical protein
MTWEVRLHAEFTPEFRVLPLTVRDALLAALHPLAALGPQLGRPQVDTLKGSKHPNMKELRFSAANGVWRVAFAFDPKREAILLIAGDKSGGGQKLFYKTLITKADARFDRHLAWLKQEKH